MAKLTQKNMEAISTNEDGKIIRDDGGLFGKIRAKSSNEVSVSFYYRYRWEGKTKDISCGTWPAESLAEIRKARNRYRDDVENSIDPADKKKADKFERQAAVAAALAEAERQRTEGLTIKDMFDAWTLDGVRRRDGNAELIRSFQADVLPKIGKKAIKAVTEHDLRSVLRAMVGRGVNRSAVMMYNNLVQMFAWAEKRQPWRKLMADGNPMTLIEIDKIISPDYDMENQRNRILSVDEIRELQAAIQRMQEAFDAALDKRHATHPLNKTLECAIWIMLSTMCRVGELSMARWEHINLDTAEWFIPKANVKDNVGDLTVFLSSFALNQFKKLAKVTGDAAWCFPARNKEDSHVCVKSMSKQIGDRQAMFKKGRDGNPRKPMKNRRSDNTLVVGNGKNGAWTAHDLRRTGATMMQSLGIPLDIIDRCQNHVLAGSKVRRHYMHHDYAEEKRDAWRRLGERLNVILTADGMLPLQHTAES